MDKKLFGQIVDFIKPFVDNPQRETYIREALYGSKILEQINFDNRSPLSMFSFELIETINKKGDINDLCQLLRALAKNGGIEQQEAAETLCQELKKELPYLASGFVIDGRYSLIEMIGRGGSGEVWKATEYLPDEVSTRTVAIKILRRDISININKENRFKQEISLASRLMHPHIIRITNWGEFGNNIYAIMDFIEGQTLREFISGKQFSDVKTVFYLGQIAEALDTAHKLNLIHRDVKPENIIIADDMLFLGDFGLAIIPKEGSKVTETGEFIGTKKYMAPEQWDNDKTLPQTDIYALGIIAYEMLTGEYPYDVSSVVKLIKQHTEDSLPPHPNLPDEVLRILQKATAKKYNERYNSATQFINELQHWKLDPENLETKILKHLTTLSSKIKGDVYEQLFVNLSGNIHKHIYLNKNKTHDSIYPDPYLEGLVEDFIINLSADELHPKREEAILVKNTLEHLAKTDKVVLIGEPGAGKSFTLRRLVMHYINNYKSLIPVFIPLSEFSGKNSETFESFVKKQMGDLGAYYDQLLSSARLILICDALNEMPRSSQDGRNLTEEVKAVLLKTPFFVVSCRIRDYTNDLQELNVERLEIRQMDLPTIKEFIWKYLKDDAPEFWGRIGGSNNLFTYWDQLVEKGKQELFWEENAETPEYTSPEADAAWTKMWEGAKLLPLARNPYLARVICSLHRRDQIPNNRAELYQAFVSNLYERELSHAKSLGKYFPTKATLEDFLMELASKMQVEHTTVWTGLNLNEVLLQAALDMNVLTHQENKIRFSHQLLQEYYVVISLSAMMHNHESPKPLMQNKWWLLNMWRETALMLAEYERDVDTVASWLGEANPELAVYLLQTRQDQSLENINHETKILIIQSAEKKINEPNPIGRAAAYRVLGALNSDNRTGIGCRTKDNIVLPAIDWREIPKGYFKYGGDPDAFQSSPASEVYLDTFQIARYPITFSQFQSFIDDEEGIKDNRWWDGLAWTSKQPYEQEWKISNHPRENINWYQAVAFCRWFSWRLGGIYDLNRVMEWHIRLPTEHEWEKAARGVEGYYYPYGFTFDNLKSNTRETNIRQTTAVGIFLEGRSPFDVLDMSGNVWEWCLTEFRSGSNHDLTNNKSRVIKGGSWNHDKDDARCADRDLGDPRDVYYGFGFRVCTSNISPAQVPP